MCLVTRLSRFKNILSDQTAKKPGVIGCACAGRGERGCLLVRIRGEADYLVYLVRGILV